METKLFVCKEIHSGFLANNEFVAFRYPVKWKDMNLLDYPLIVKQPMDLTSIDKKLKKGRYITSVDFVFDMRLIYHNCMLFNHDASPLYELGKRFKHEFEAKVTEFSLFDYSFRVPYTKSPQQEIKLRRELEKASQEVKDAAFTLLETLCPECINKTDDTHYTISYKNMDAETLDYIIEYIVSLKS